MHSPDAATTPLPDLIYATDGEWHYYVPGHDEGELLVIDDLDVLEWDRLWMRSISASQCEDYGLSNDDPDDNVLRNPTTGRFEARRCWIECPESANGAEPWMGVRYVH